MPRKVIPKKRVKRTRNPDIVWSSPKTVVGVDPAAPNGDHTAYVMVKDGRVTDVATRPYPASLARAGEDPNAFLIVQPPDYDEYLRDLATRLVLDHVVVVKTSVVMQRTKLSRAGVDLYFEAQSLHKYRFGGRRTVWVPLPDVEAMVQLRQAK